MPNEAAVDVTTAKLYDNTTFNSCMMDVIKWRRLSDRANGQQIGLQDKIIDNLAKTTFNRVTQKRFTDSINREVNSKAA